MNKYKKYCPNVFIAECEKEYKKGDIIVITTKYGKENEHIIHNFIGYTGTKENPLYCYSITRVDGFNSRTRALNKVEKLTEWSEKAVKHSDDWREKSNEGADFLRLAEPIKIGHHSENRHRNLINRNHNRMGNCIKELEKAQQHENKKDYWEKKAEKIDLSMPESIDYFKNEFEKAIEYHEGLKNGSIKKEHSYSIVYANKKRKEMEKNFNIAVKLWS